MIKNTFLILIILTIVFLLPTRLFAEEASRGIAGDFWAYIVLGKRDFGENGPKQIVNYKLFNPGGVVVDRSVNPGRMYVWDGGNNRILGINLAKCYAQNTPCQADIVIGQP